MSSFTHIAILGRQPELGLVELESLLGHDAVKPFGRQAVLLSEAVKVDRIGGALKVAEVIYEGAPLPLRELPIDVEKLPLGDSKTSFGISLYGLRETPKALMAAGLELKKKLRERGSVRLVQPSKGLALTAAELRHNRVVESGFELLVVAAEGQMVIALTTGVQDIDWYSRRDYDRPARSAKVGMLPPKLAQILVNTTAAHAAVYDPFCGTGVVLQEALLLGRPAAGSDLAGDMVQASQTNLEWLQHEVPVPLPAWSVSEADAQTVKLPAGSVVVSEGYLGPNLTASPTPRDLEKIRAELLPLYRHCLQSWAREMTAGTEVSLCVPAWRESGNWRYLGLVDELPKLGYTLKGFKHVRTPLLYARDDQIVGRQLLLLRKN